MDEPINKGSRLENLRVIDASSDGQSVARMDNAVVFIEGGVPGDLVDVEVYRKKKKFFEARIVAFKETSPDRRDPICTHFGICGGCKWQHMSYEKQLFFKQEQVEQALVRIGKIEIPEIRPILGSKKTEFYRNRLEFTFSNKRWLTREEIGTDASATQDVLGFHVPGRFDKILDVQKCYLQDDLSNQIRNAVKQFCIDHQFEFFDVINLHGFMRNLIIRSTSTGEWMVNVVFHEDKKEERNLLMNFLKDKFPQITSLQYIINPKRNDTVFDLPVHLFSGRDYILEEMEGLKFKISAKSFYQTNSEQAYELYKITRDFAGLNGKELVYDLYTGTGTIANFIARNARHVVGIENVPVAIEDAKENAKENGLSNTTFIAGDIKDTLTSAFVLEHGRPDVIITDPPRAGMHPDVVRKMLELFPEKIVYVSCNPGTQARDLAMLDEKYKVEAIQPVDMFPHTTHVENVVLLKRKEIADQSI
ncbi:MAG: 23S rRNA (uracil(1939)-C(5))-methyltransferase RlmD [Bacteroidetes bacterium]|nr:23S rRNA (uracil(1939)-C(5))-methyltransferase RlmD [Bacteroidota bacterium]MBL0139821.1 23S rRNA (uracil(1939)-C(5))-methyltransferase RlmD [Bacteroidota bacterium]